MTRRGALLFALLCFAFGLCGDFAAESYIGRLPNHAGYHLVPVSDAIATAHLQQNQPPRHVVLVVVDGLRADHAAKMNAAQRLRTLGQCRDTDVGSLSVSRPVYAVISTGLEQDRTGSRNNDSTAPLFAESLWQVARRAGRRVTAVSELTWFQQLFPDGFSSYVTVARSADHFTASESELGDLALFHPIYVDEAGHEFGGASPQYQAAVARADVELSRLLDRLDLSRDVVVLTADHGHTDRGGHGGLSREVAHVLTCFAGRGITHLAEGAPAAFQSRTLAPTLTVLSLLPFPRHMRAGEDGLDAMWQVIDPHAYSASYLADRRAAIQRFRDENSVAVGRILGRSTGANWSELYAHARQDQTARACAILFVALLCGFAVLRRRLLPHPLRTLLFCGGAWLVLVILWTHFRGSFDFDSVNGRSEFVRWSLLCALVATLTASAIHWLIVRDGAALRHDYLRLLYVLLLLQVMHVAAFGWPLGFPLPNPLCFFFPFIGGAQLALAGFLGMFYGLFRAVR